MGGGGDCEGRKAIQDALASWSPQWTAGVYSNWGYATLGFV